MEQLSNSSVEKTYEEQLVAHISSFRFQDTGLLQKRQTPLSSTEEVNEEPQSDVQRNPDGVKTESPAQEQTKAEAVQEAPEDEDEGSGRRTNLVESSFTVEVDNAHLRSVVDWKELNLDEDLMKGILHKGFERPSKIQATALPDIIALDKNIIAQAQNGSGKTATFALAMLSKIDRSNKDPQGLCLCPTRELARQNLAVIADLGKFTCITLFLAVPQCDGYDSYTGAQIIVGTPGKTLELLKKRYLPTSSVRMFVLDEADQMIDRRQNMQPQVQQIRGFFGGNLQLLLFSATYPDEVRKFAEEMIPNPAMLKVKKENLALKYINQFYRICTDKNNKMKQLADLYACMTIGQSIVFVNNRRFAFELSLWMREQGHAVTLICGTQTSGPAKMDHALRDKIMEEFRKGETKVLITTDVLSRGIDVPQVTMVVNFDLPRALTHTDDYLEETNARQSINMETYLHRIGRTGRFGLKGIAVSLVQRTELQFIRQIRDYYKCSINELPSDPDEIDEMLRKMRK